MSMIIAAFIGALTASSFGLAGVAAFILGHLAAVALLVAVLTTIMAGFHRPPAKRRTSPPRRPNRPVITIPGAPVPPRHNSPRAGHVYP